MQRVEYRRFARVKSRTPLYHEINRKFYWSHCWYCGIELIYDKKLKKLKPNSFTRDHVIPESAGGRKGNNTVPACNRCNMRKKDMSLEVFRVRLVGKGKLFYGENRELELRLQLENTNIALQTITMPQEFEYKPKPVKCFVRRELILYTGLTRMLRRLVRN